MMALALPIVNTEMYIIALTFPGWMDNKLKGSEVLFWVRGSETECGMAWDWDILMGRLREGSGTLRTPLGTVVTFSLHDALAFHCINKYCTHFIMYVNIYTHHIYTRNKCTLHIGYLNKYTC